MGWDAKFQIWDGIDSGCGMGLIPGSGIGGIPVILIFKNGMGSVGMGRDSTRGGNGMA